MDMNILRHKGRSNHFWQQVHSQKWPAVSFSYAKAGAVSTLTDTQRYSSFLIVHAYLALFVLEYPLEYGLSIKCTESNHQAASIHYLSLEILTIFSVFSGYYKHMAQNTRSLCFSPLPMHSDIIISIF